ncbi:acyltransferase [Fibrobacter sp. UWB5]|uniref:acyltransferase family protein n=1 Tax=Fibrobacter sp. UWB5 TaxID=1964360 RepID=UPI000B69EF2F|nr:acyltransferase [Fibrobacter sp. UWB5]OWV14345.1 hypothetical protein B7989_02495 [Fibrobacter sp. UWB5]
MHTSKTDYRITLDETWIIKAIAIMAMLVHHLFFDQPSFGAIMVNIGMIGKICVTLFVFLSGYGMTASFPKVQQNIAKTHIFILCKRYTKFFLNYWFIFFIAVSVGVFCFGRSLEVAYGENSNIVKSFMSDMLGQQSFCSYNITWWFNAVILGLWLLFPFLYQTMKRRVVCICMLVFLFANPNDILLLLNYIAPGLSTYIFPFTLGIFIALHIARINRILNIVHPYIVLCVSLVAATVLLFLRGFPVLSGFTGFAVEPFATVFVALAVVSLCRVTGRRFVAMQYVGKHSMNMYLTHTFIYGYFFHNFIYGFKYPILIFLALFATSLLLSVCIEFVKKRIGFHKLQGKVVGIINKVGGIQCTNKQYDVRKV